MQLLQTQPIRERKMLNSSLLEDLETDLHVARLRERIAQKNVITSENDIERAIAKRHLERRGKEVAEIQRTIDQLKDERKWKWF
jgi:Zn-finger domain-containing protein